ncbi:hypothetical protein CSUI_002761 [Cystoisospora suis]|uniref:Uncharacterized protein n=1 Tax=Cystoisospora suis TaxID=483139 RepID=A0A2C6L7S7_9APIC|nr:hypothetical protein CSUI_002761 [Cystoisospora suis]
MSAPSTPQHAAVVESPEFMSPDMPAVTLPVTTSHVYEEELQHQVPSDMGGYLPPCYTHDAWKVQDGVLLDPPANLIAACPDTGAPSPGTAVRYMLVSSTKGSSIPQAFVAPPLGVPTEKQCITVTFSGGVESTPYAAPHFSPAEAPAPEAARCGCW